MKSHCSGKADCVLHFLSVFGVHPGETRHPQVSEELPALHPRAEHIELPSVATLMSGANEMRRRLPPRLPSLWYESTKLKRIENRWFEDYYGHQQCLGQPIRIPKVPLAIQRNQRQSNSSRQPRGGRITERRQRGRKSLMVEVLRADDKNSRRTWRTS